MRSAGLLVLATATSAFAQTVGNYSSSYDMTINPGSVSEDTREEWCQAQYNTCRTLCNQNTNSNNCDSDNLQWTCTCASNNSRPGLEYYQQTMPSFICKELFGQCQASTDDSQIQGECADNINEKCGELPPPSVSQIAEEDSPSSTPEAESSTSTTTSGRSEATSNDVTTTSSKDIAAPTLVPGNGVAAVAAIGVLAYML